MKEDEVLIMAKDAGLIWLTIQGFALAKAEHEAHIDAELIAFANTILERAAAECDATKTRYKGMAEEEDKTLLKAGECSDYWSHVSALAGAAYDIRALKINTGD